MIAPPMIWTGFKALYSQTPELMFCLANQLASGKSLIEALENLSLIASSKRMANTAKKTAELLKQGKTADEVFANKVFSAFPPQVRYILGTPLPDKIKGQILRGLYLKRATGNSLTGALMVPVFTILITLFVSFTLMMFVFPQFKEILWGMRIELTPFLNFIFSFDILALQPAHLVLIFSVFLVILCLFFLVKFVLKISLFEEKGRFLRLMAEVDSSKRIEILRYLSSRVIFPSFYQKLFLFKEALNSGKNIEESFEAADFSPTLRWFFALGLQGDNSREMLTNGADLYSEVFKARTAVIATCIEIFAILLTGIFIGSLMLAVFSAMGLMLEHLTGQGI